MSKKSKMKEREEASYIAPFMIGENYKPACVNVYEDDTCIIDEDNL